MSTKSGKTKRSLLDHNKMTLDKIDHLRIKDEKGQDLVCLCGPFQTSWLPIQVVIESLVTFKGFV